MAPETRNMRKQNPIPSEKAPAKKQKRKSIEEEGTTAEPPPQTVETEPRTAAPAGEAIPTEEISTEAVPTEEISPEAVPTVEAVPTTGPERREEDEEEEEEKEEEEDEEEEDEEEDEQEDEQEKEEEEEEEENDESGEEENDEFGAEEGDQSVENEAESPESDGVIRPELFLKPDVYCKSIKLPTRCFVQEVMETFRKLDMTPMERKWFEEHPQFRHILHMPISNHMVQPLWMMLMRTAKIERKKEAWFVVNGVPIRYGLEEHALISGLNCKNYPPYWAKREKYYMKEKYFPDKKKVLREDVKKKLEEMEADDSGERLKMMVLYFLSSIIYAPTKTGDKGTGVLNVFLKYAGDLEKCKTFPWGKLSFDRMLESISDVMNHLVEKGLGDACSFPGFCIPLEILPTEAILQLKEGLREDVPSPEEDCPRMCRSKWKKCGLRGWPLEAVYEKLGSDNKDINSVLMIASEEEEARLDMIMEPEDDDDVHDPVVLSWEKRLDAGLTVVFEDMKEEDVQGRRINVEEGATAKNGGKRKSLRDVVAAMENMTEQLGLLNSKVHGMDERIKSLEETIKAQQLSGS